MSAPLVNTTPKTCCPKKYLWNWREILDALGMPNDAESHRRVRDANTRFDGPITMPPKGGQPKVCKDSLIVWWNDLEERFRELDKRQSDKVATLAASYQYGKEATVYPDISGHAKKRREG